MENQNQRQTNNKAYVTGKLKDKKLNFKPNKNGKLMATGHLVIAVNTEMGTGEIKVKVMQFAEKKDGGANPLFKALQTIENEYKSIVVHGEENADVIRIEGSIKDSTYYSMQKGDFVEILEVEGRFFNRVSADTPHCCKVCVEGYISKITPNGEELDVELIGIGYQGVAVPVTGTIRKELVAPFQGKYMVGCTATLNIAIVNHVETSQIQSEVGFGESIGEAINKTTTKRIIFGGENPKYAGTQDAISEEEVKKALAIREAELAKKKEDAMNRADAGAGNMTTGFGSFTAGGGMPTGTTPTGFGAGMPQGGFGSFPTGNPVG